MRDIFTPVVSIDQAPPRVKIWSQKTGIRLLIGFGVLVLALLVYLVEERIRGKIELDRWMAKMRAQGAHFTVAEIAPPPALPNDNAAPEVGAVFGGGTYVPHLLHASMQMVGPAKAAAIVREKQWYGMGTQTAFTTNGLNFRQSAARRPAGMTNAVSNAVPVLITVAELARDIDTAHDGLERLRSALKRPGLDFGVDYSSGFSTLLPHLSRFKTTTLWLRASSLKCLLQNDVAGSLEDLTAIARFVHLQTNGPLMIDQLVRFANIQIGVAAIWEALQAEGWTDQQLAELQQAWQTDHAVLWAAHSLDMEGVMGLQEIDRMIAEGPDLFLNAMGVTPSTPATPPKDFTDVLAQLPDTAGPALFRGVVFPVWRFAWKDQDKLFHLKSMRRQIEPLYKQEAQPNWVAYQPADENDQNEDRNWGEMARNVDPRYLASRLFGGFGGRIGTKAVETETSRLLAETAIAIKRFQLSTGHIPNTLDELSPKYLSKVPIDLFDGKPLRYKAGPGNAFVLYSVGRNGTDDGGDSTTARPGGTGFSFVGGRDMVWPQPASTAEVELFEKSKR